MNREERRRWKKVERSSDREFRIVMTEDGKLTVNDVDLTEWLVEVDQDKPTPDKAKALGPGS